MKVEDDHKKTEKFIYLDSNIEYLSLYDAIKKLLIEKDSYIYQNAIEFEVIKAGELKIQREQLEDSFDINEKEKRKERLNKICKEMGKEIDIDKISNLWSVLRKSRQQKETEIFEKILKKQENKPAIRGYNIKRLRFIKGIANAEEILKNNRQKKIEDLDISISNDNHKLPVFQEQLPETRIYTSTLNYPELSNPIKKLFTTKITELELLYTSMIKSYINKCYKSYLTASNMKRNYLKKLSSICSKEIKRSNMKNIKSSKDYPLKAKKIFKEIMSFYRRIEKEEREKKKKKEKEYYEKSKAEEESRKLDFLINQTELYSHFIAKKRDNTNIKTIQNSNINQENIDLKSSKVNDINLELSEKAKINAINAVGRQIAYTKEFDKNFNLKNSYLNQNPNSLPNSSDIINEPSILQCKLKLYQKHGLYWLAKLYEQGINGILADEMGLGKTVQSISLMAHLAERHNIWGPFLIITPASTLHNWHQELKRFVPSFKTIPYWGNINERRTFRRFWSTDPPGEKDSPFHILITSYQLVLTDEKYLSKVKWQYMILDEAQAIKSSGSNRWKILLGFKCRNRLLLTGTPIQNTMQELWALLHFIMPTLFDSQNEFAEWFSKDIESHAENKSALDERRLSRLHMVLKPFMLRRIKKDIGNELSEKIEINIPCYLSPKQQYWYSLCKRKLQKEHGLFLDQLNDSKISKNINVDHLANLVMQFRKICNHPELIKKAEVKSPFYISNYIFPMTEEFNFIYQTQSLIKFQAPYQLFNIIKKPIISFKLYQFKYFFDKFISKFFYHKLDNELSNDLKLLNQRYFNNNNNNNNIIHFKLTHIQIPKYYKLNNNHFYNRFKGIYIPSFTAPPPLKLVTNCNLFNDNLNTELNCIKNRLISLSKLPLFKKFVPILKPKIQDLINESGKMIVLEKLLEKLKLEGHRVLIYFQMTKMMDLMEDYLGFKGYPYLRLDGSSKISNRRDMVTDWQNNDDIFIFLLSTRAGGLGINLTAADTVIFYDSDWNPTIDQQAMDRAHRLGQAKQVTVYRLITQNTIEERIQQRASQKDKIQKVVISGDLKARSIVSLLIEEKKE